MISLMLAGGWVQAQRQKMETSKLQKDTLSMLLRICEDNDFFNIRGQGTDDAYTNGTRMFTPNDLTKASYQPDDYPYSGALIITHSLYSYDPFNKYDFQTELVFGAMGPIALAAETQTSVHRLIHYQLPMGWKHQFRNAPLVNPEYFFCHDERII